MAGNDEKVCESAKMMKMAVLVVFGTKLVKRVWFDHPS
jgi:hypothetical protein